MPFLLLAFVAIIVYGISVKAETLTASTADNTFLNDPVGYVMNTIFEARIEPYQDMITQSASDYNIDPRLIKAVIFTESSGKAGEDSGDSVGLMQVNFSGAVKYFGYTGTRDDLFDPATNINMGTKILKDAINHVGSKGIDYVYAYYNDGRATKNELGQFINSKGDTIVQAHVDNFLKKYAQV